MNVFNIFDIEDIGNIILLMLGSYAKNIRPLSTYFNNVFTKFVNAHCTMNPSIKINCDLYDVDAVNIIAKYKCFLQNEPTLTLFYLNHFNLSIINNICEDECKNAYKKIDALKLYRKQRNKKIVHGTYVSDDDVSNLIKTTGLYIQTLQQEKRAMNNGIYKNYKLLCDVKNPNYGIFKLASMLKDINILKLRRITDISLLEKCNMLWSYIRDIRNNNCTGILNQLRNYLLKDNRHKPCTCINTNKHSMACLLDGEYADEEFNNIYTKMQNYKH